MKIQVKLFKGGLMPKIDPKGDCYDLFTAEDVEVKAPQAHVQRQVNGEKVRDVSFDNKLVPLGIAMKLPRGFKCNVYPRSSTFKNTRTLLVNSVGQIDNSYSGNNDQWKYWLIATDNAVIPAGTKICQFEIVLSQRAHFWQKLRWFLWNGKVKFVQVDYLNSSNRGGFGSTGN